MHYMYSTPNMLAKIFPIIIDDIGPRIVVGTTCSGDGSGGVKVVTKLNSATLWCVVCGSRSVLGDTAATRATGAVRFRLYYQGQ